MTTRIAVRFPLRSLLLSLGWFLFAGAHPAAGAEAAPSGERPVERYGSLPKGVTLESTGTGLPAVGSLQYDRGKNRFLVNRSFYYANPLTREETRRLALALAEDDRVGVSVRLAPGEREPRGMIVYGALSRRDRMVKDLVRADLFLCAIVFGWTHLLEGERLPGGYRPKSPAQRRVNAVCFCNFTDYRFVVSGTTARRVGVDLKILLVPMAEERAPDGGYLPDYERLARGEVEPTDRANLAHLLAYEADYLERPAVARAVRIGEAAAFLRHLRASRINLRALARAMR